MMLLFDRDPHSTVMLNEEQLKAANSSVKEVLLDITVPKLLSNYGSIINTRGRWLLIVPCDITHPCIANVKDI